VKMQEVETMSEILGSVTIRAPALYRLLSNIYTLTIKTPEVFLGKINNDFYPSIGVESEDGMVLATMVYQMSTTKSAGTGFPTKNMDLLAKALMRVVRCYAIMPEIYSKINTLWAAQLVSSLIAPCIDMNAANMRAQEIKDLNQVFYNLSKNTGSQEVVASCEKLDIIEATLNPDSEFIVFTVKVA